MKTPNKKQKKRTEGDVPHKFIYTKQFIKSISCLKYFYIKEIVTVKLNRLGCKPVIT